MHHKFIIQGCPIPYRKLQGGSRRDFDEQKQEKLHLSQTVINMYGDLPPMQGPLQIEVKFYFPIPRNSPARQQQMRNTAYYYKPNIENLVEFVQQAVRGILYETTAVISSLNAQKLYDFTPRTEFLITELNNDKR